MTSSLVLGFVAAAFAHDPAPSMYVPSTAPDRDHAVVAEGQMGVGYRSFEADWDGGAWTRGTLQWGRVAGGFHVQGIVGSAVKTTGWLGVALIDAEHVRLQIHGVAGTQLGGGASVVARTARGGIGGHGYQFDLAWSPRWNTESLVEDSWAGPFDLLGSLPEAGVAMPVHPGGTQFLRVGLMGPNITVAYRLDLTANQPGGFVLESMLGGGPFGGVATVAVGWGGAGGKEQRVRSRPTISGVDAVR